MTILDDMRRYVADQTENGDPMVLDVSTDPARLVCGCRTDADAEMIARALNNQGAVERVTLVEQALLIACGNDKDAAARFVRMAQALEHPGGR